MLLGNQSISVTRFKENSWSGGRRVKVVDNTFTIDANWQPVKGRELENMELGKRAGQIFKGYTDTELKTVREIGNKTYPADMITKDGFDYDVIVVEPWQNGLISHYKFVVEKVLE